MDSGAPCKRYEDIVAGRRAVRTGSAVRVWRLSADPSDAEVDAPAGPASAAVAAAAARRAVRRPLQRRPGPAGANYALDVPVRPSDRVWIVKSPDASLVVT